LWVNILEEDKIDLRRLQLWQYSWRRLRKDWRLLISALQGTSKKQG
jgi:hypothetical protein